MFLFGGGGSNNSNNKQSQNENSSDNLGKALRNKIVNIYKYFILTFVYYRLKICLMKQLNMFPEVI